jgi:hypothetical protein
MSVYEVFEIIRSGGYFILYFFPQKPILTVIEKKSRTHPILKSSPSVTVDDSEFIFFGDKFVKHFSLQFQQLNWFCQSFDAKH